MDKTLHARPAAETPLPATRAVSEAEPNSDNGDTAQMEFRDLQIEPRKPPVRVRFNPPVEYDGKTYAELTFDFDSMTGRDFVRCERKFNALYKPSKNEIPMPEMKPLYHEIILGELAGVPHTMIEKLERRYYVPLRTEALKACGSSQDEKDEKQ